MTIKEKILTIFKEAEKILKEEKIDTLEKLNKEIHALYASLSQIPSPITEINIDISILAPTIFEKLGGCLLPTNTAIALTAEKEIALYSFLKAGKPIAKIVRSEQEVEDIHNELKDYYRFIFIETLGVSPETFSRIENMSL